MGNIWAAIILFIKVKSYKSVIRGNKMRGTSRNYSLIKGKQIMEEQITHNYEGTNHNYRTITTYYIFHTFHLKVEYLKFL